jgi:hypothetical protein
MAEDPEGGTISVGTQTPVHQRRKYIELITVHGDGEGKAYLFTSDGKYKRWGTGDAVVKVYKSGMINKDKRDEYEMRAFRE